MTDVVLNNITSGYNISKINDNFDKIKNNVNSNVLHTHGGGNIMDQDLDMNSNNILNVATDLTNPSSLVNVDALNSVKSSLDAETVARVAGDTASRDYADQVVAGVVGGYGSFLQEGVGAVERTFQDKERDIVSIKDFGAVGDGITDDTSAVEALSSPSYLPEGNYPTATHPAVDTNGPGSIVYNGLPLVNAGYNTAVDSSRAGKMAFLKELPERFNSTDYNNLIATYGYSYIYPQSFAIDEDAGEIWVVNSPDAGGSNFWAWVVVYDLASGAEKVVFSTPATTYTEGVVLRNIDGKRYMYLAEDTKVARYDVTSLPANLSALTAESLSEDIGMRDTLFANGDRIYAEVNTPGQQTYKNMFYVLDLDLNVVGTMETSIDVTGKPFGAGADGSLPKKQGTGGIGGNLVCMYGGIYRTDIPTDYVPRYNDIGAVIATLDGRVLMDSRVSALEVLDHLAGINPDVTRTELEGCYVTRDGRLLALIATSPTGSERFSRGLWLTEFASDRSDAIDFRPVRAQPLPAISRPSWIPLRGGRSSDLPMLNPYTGERFSTLGSICEFMGEAQIYELHFYTTNFTNIIGPDGLALPSSRMVNIRNRNNLRFDVDIENFPTNGLDVYHYIYILPDQTWQLSTAVIYGYTAPTGGAWVAGCKVYNRSPSAGGYVGWVCVANGTPGTWKQFGAIEA